MSHDNFGGPSGLPLIVLYIAIAVVACALVVGSFAPLIPVALGIAAGLWVARIIAGG